MEIVEITCYTITLNPKLKLALMDLLLKFLLYPNPLNFKP